MSLPAGVEAPKQDRSRRSYNRILEATAELLARRPFDEITVDEIAERAGYTKGAFYHRFDSKAVLLRHLVARLTSGALEAWRDFLDPAEWKEVSLADFLEAYIHRLVNIYSRSTHLMGAFSFEARWGSDEVLRETAAHLNREVLAGFQAVVLDHADELAPAVRSDPREAVRFWMTSLAALLQSTWLWRDDAMAPRADAPAIEAQARRLLVPYLVKAEG